MFGSFFVERPSLLYLGAEWPFGLFLFARTQAFLWRILFAPRLEIWSRRVFCFLHYYYSILRLCCSAAEWRLKIDKIEIKFYSIFGQSKWPLGIDAVRCATDAMSMCDTISYFYVSLLCVVGSLNCEPRKWVLEWCGASVVGSSHNSYILCKLSLINNWLGNTKFVWIFLPNHRHSHSKRIVAARFHISNYVTKCRKAQLKTKGTKRNVKLCVGSEEATAALCCRIVGGLSHRIFCWEDVPSE